MPAAPIGLLLAGVGAAIGTAAPALATGLILGGVSMLASSVVQSLSAPSKPQPASMSQEKKQGPGHLINTQSTQETVKVVYGEMLIGVNRVYIDTTGTNNNLLHLIAALGEGPIDSLQALYLDNELIATYGSNASYVFYDGASDQSYDTTLHGYNSDWTDALRNTAYVYLKLIYDGDKFGSFPEITALIRGREIFDVRDSSTAYSTNNALVLWDYLTNGLYGLGIDSSTYLDTASFQTAANACDTNGFSFNGAIVDRENSLDIIQRILDSCRGVLIWSGGKFKMLILDYTASVMSITEDDIITGSVSAVTPSTQDVINSYKVKYINKDNNYVVEDLPVPVSTYVTEDSGEIKEKEKFFLGITSYDLAQKLAMYAVKRSRFSREYYLRCRPKAIALEPGDMIDVTCSLFGWTAQVCRVFTVEPQPDRTVALMVLKEDSSLYSYTVNTASHVEYSTTLPDPLAVPPSVTNIEWSEDTYVQGDNTYSQIKITFDPPVDYPFFDYAEAYITWGSDTTAPIADGAYLADGTLLAGSGVFRFLGKNSTGFTVNNLRELQSFRLKLLAVSLYKVKQTLSNVGYSYITVTGVSTVPSNVGGFQVIPARGDLNFRWTAISASETDLLYYELRYGVSWNQSILVSRTKGTMYTLASIRPATHTFVLKARNTAGRYSANDASFTVVTQSPVGYTEFGSSPYNEDYDSGTYNNTSYEDDPTFGRILYVSTGTTGDYTGVTFDLGSVAVRRFWLSELVIHYAGVGTTWETLFGATELWTDKISAGQCWAQVLGQAVCGDLRVVLYYSEDSETFYPIDNFQLFQAEVSCRYIKIQLYIENASTSNYIKVEDVNIRCYTA